MVPVQCTRRTMHVATVTVLLLAVCVPLASAALSPYFRPPAFPIFANNPYWSVWSLSDAPGRSWTEHANGGVQGMTGFAKVDSTYYRFLGVPSVGGTGIIVDPISTQILPLSTVYTFKLGTAIQMVLTFSNPAQLDDDTLVSVPVTYVTFALSSLDGASHTVSLYIDHTAELVVADPATSVNWADLSSSGTGTNTIIRMGANVQSVLSGSTNDRINWGNAYMAAPKETALVGTVSSDANCRNAFISGAAAPALQTGPRNGNDNWPVLSLRWNGLSVTSTTSVTKFMTLSYDNVNTMNFFSKVLPPLWSTKIGTILTVIAQMHTNYATYMSAINARNTALVTLFDKRGSNSYTTLLSLVYRQVTASTEHAIDTTTQQHYVFMKTFATSSTNGPVNGQVNAVTTMFFASPFYLLLNPSLVPKMLLPVLKYANSETSFPYTRSWAPSHLGQWPLCTTAVPTTYDMPVEHTANMLIMITAAAQRGAPLTYLQPYWPLLTTWANYLVASLPFPTSQLFVDSYGTASANNVNLAMKGAIGVGAYSLLLSLTGNTTAAAQYMNSATSFASQILAQSFSTDHYLREKGAAATTWSLKYNLLFDRVLKLGLFADAVMTTEQTFYTPKMGAYGLPVDSTTSANGRVGEQGFVAATGTTAQFTSIFDKLFLYANTTASRLPLGDYYVVGSGANVDFRAGAFVGGLYARELLEDVRAVASTSSISARAASTVSAATASSASLASFSSASIASASSASLGSASSASIASASIASSQSASIASASSASAASVASSASASIASASSASDASLATASSEAWQTSVASEASAASDASVASSASATVASASSASDASVATASSASDASVSSASLASDASDASVASSVSASVASVSSASDASVASVASDATVASDASVASSVSASVATVSSASDASDASVASTASASLATVSSASGASLASASSAAWQTSAASAASAAAAAGSDSDSTPIIIGVVVGVVCLLLIVLVIALVLRRRRVRKPASAPAFDSTAPFFQVPSSIVANSTFDPSYDDLHTPSEPNYDTLQNVSGAETKSEAAVVSESTYDELKGAHSGAPQSETLYSELRTSHPPQDSPTQEDALKATD